MMLRFCWACAGASDRCAATPSAAAKVASRPRAGANWRRRARPATASPCDPGGCGHLGLGFALHRLLAKGLMTAGHHAAPWKDAYYGDRTAIGTGISCVDPLAAQPGGAVPRHGDLQGGRPARRIGAQHRAPGGGRAGGAGPAGGARGRAAAHRQRAHRLHAVPWPAEPARAHRPPLPRRLWRFGRSVAGGGDDRVVRRLRPVVHRPVRAGRAGGHRRAGLSRPTATFSKRSASRS